MRGRLSDALAVMLPSRVETAFLQACLLSGPTLPTAWDGWQRAVGDPVRFLREDGHALRGHLPLLHRNLTHHGVAVPPELRAILRGAVVREQLRFATYERYFAEAMAALAAADVDVTVLKGAAVARTLVRPSSLRHCHDLDLWVRDTDRSRAVAALVAAGFAAAAEHTGTTRVTHARGFPVMLHTQLIRGAVYRLPVDAMWDRRVGHEAGDGAFWTFAPRDGLLHTSAHASTVGRRPHANWVVDAHRLSATLDAEAWTGWLDDARRAGLALPLSVLFRYLRDALAAPVPAAIVDGLVAEAERAPGGAMLAAIDGAWLGRPGGLAAMLRRSGWHSRLTVARCVALPPPSYLRATRGSMGGGRLVVEYALRPLRFLRRHTAGGIARSS